MAKHYVYADPDKTSLKQGDVLDRTADLTRLLLEYHPYFGRHEAYKYFMVLTQTCDLVRRPKPKSRYINLAAVRAIEDVLRLEAAKSQDQWQKETRCISGKLKGGLMLFLARLLNNNEPEYFYLHEDQTLGLTGNNCAFLAVSVPLRVEHYECCLQAKTSELKEPFQAKLGWLIGNLFSRVGTAEWDAEVPDKKLSAAAKEIVDATFITVDDQQISQGLKTLRQQEGFRGMSAKDVLEYVRSVKIVKKSKRFQDRAVEVLRGSNLIDLIQGRVIQAVIGDESLRHGIAAIVQKPEGDQEGEVSDRVVSLFGDRLRKLLERKSFPDRESLYRKLVASITNDPQVSAILAGR
jgi:hypothetical protein